MLPAIFLTVTAAGGFRALPSGGGFQFVPPPLVHLVLAMLAMSVLVTSGAFAPERLMASTRTSLENLCGAVVLVTLFSATAQALNAVTPDAGLLHAIFVAFFGLLFWNTLAVRPDAIRVRRSFFLLFGAALVARHVVIASLYAPEPTLAKRVLTALLEGATLGSLHYVPTAPLTGYVAFAAIVLYFVGLLLVPATPPPGGRRDIALAPPGGPHDEPR